MSSLPRSDALVLKDASYTSKVILDPDVLEGRNPEGDSQSSVTLDVESGFYPYRSASPLGTVTTLPLSVIDGSSFKGFMDRPLESVGLLHVFTCPLTQHIGSSSFEELQTTTEVSNIVRLVNEAFHCLSSFNLDLRSLHNQVYTLRHFMRELLHTEAAF